MATTDTHNNLDLPVAIDAEQALLGGLLRETSQFQKIIAKFSLTEDLFFSDLHKKIFSTMLRLDAQNIQADIITILHHSDHTEKNSPITQEYLIYLYECCPLIQNLEYYADILEQKDRQRRIIKACNAAIKKSVDGLSWLSTVGDLERELFEVVKGSDHGKGLIKAKDILIPALEELEKRINSEGIVTGIDSGFNDLDQITGGWQRSDLIILAARPGMGKSALALNFAMNALRKKEDLIVAVFTLEMSKEQLIERILSAEGRIDSSRLRTGSLSDEDQDRLMSAARSLNHMGDRLNIDETPGITLTDLRSRLRRQKKEHGLGMVIIDYLQLMSGSELSRKQGREREISEISSGLKAIAKELDIPIIALAQLNRGPDSRPDKKPKISDLRESGSMEQDADLILFVYRDDYYNSHSEQRGIADVLIAKNRHGETASIQLAWLPNFVSFHNLLRE